MDAVGLLGRMRHQTHYAIYQHVVPANRGGSTGVWGQSEVPARLNVPYISTPSFLKGARIQSELRAQQLENERAQMEMDEMARRFQQEERRRALLLQILQLELQQLGRESAGEGQ